jgi:hypothetical protein
LPGPGANSSGEIMLTTSSIRIFHDLAI